MSETSPVGPGAQQEESTPAPCGGTTKRRRGAPARVAALFTSPKTVHADIDQLLGLAGCDATLDPGSATILKDNISWHKPFLSANTTPWQLEGTILALRRRGLADLVAVHNDTVVTNPVVGERLNKLAPVYERHEVPELYTYLPGNVRWVEYRPQHAMLVLDRIFPEGIRIPDVFVGTNIVHLPTVKCHIYTTTTGAMKNAFGGLLARHRHYTHSWIHETLVDLLAIQQEIHAGVFAVMDGTLCGDGPGPRTMQPVQADLMLAAADQVAIDAVAARLMGFDPLSIKYIRLAHEHGLGCGDPREIEVAGANLSSVNLRCHVGANLPSRFGRGAWFGPLRPLQGLLFHTPLVHAFAKASAVYHDDVWWPLVGRRIQNQVRRHTAWGRYFEEL